MSDIHVKILQDAKAYLIEGSGYRHLCNAVKCVTNYYRIDFESDARIAVDEIVSHIETTIFPDIIFESWLLSTNKISCELCDDCMNREVYETSEVKQMRIDWIDELIEHFQK